MKRRTEQTGSKNNDWETPQYIYNFMRRTFFQGMEIFDPCPLKSTFDGLICAWGSFNYINPPYSPAKLKESFILKSFEESKKGKLCVMLIPSGTETRIFHNIIVPNAKVFLIKTRVRFKGFNSEGVYVTNRTGQTGSMFVVFGKGYSPGITTLDLKEE